MRYTLLLNAVLALAQVTGSHFNGFGDIHTTGTGLGIGESTWDGPPEVGADYLELMGGSESDFEFTDFPDEGQGNVSITDMPPSAPPSQGEIGPRNTPHGFGQPAAQGLNVHQGLSSEGTPQAFSARSADEISMNNSPPLSILGYSPTLLQPQQPFVASNNAGKELSHSELNEMLALSQWLGGSGHVGTNPLDPSLRQPARISTPPGVASATTMPGHVQQTNPFQAIRPLGPSLAHQWTSLAGSLHGPSPQTMPTDGTTGMNISPFAVTYINPMGYPTVPADPRLAQNTPLPFLGNQFIYGRLPGGVVHGHAALQSSMTRHQANVNDQLRRSTRNSGKSSNPKSPEAVNNRSVINQQPLAPNLSASEQAIPSTKADWFGGPVTLCSNLVRKRAEKWPFSFKRQFILAPSYISFDEVSHDSVGITGESDRFSFMVRPALIIFTEGQQKSPLMTKLNPYNKKLVTALRQSEVGTKRAFGIGGNGLFLILENGPQTRLHVRAIGQLPVALKVMRRNEDKWEAVLASEPGKAGYCDITGNEVVVIGESDEISTERNLPIENPDLWGKLQAMTESPFRFLISAQLVNLNISLERLPVATFRSVSLTMRDQSRQAASPQAMHPLGPSLADQTMSTGGQGIAINNAHNCEGVVQDESQMVNFGRDSTLAHSMYASRESFLPQEEVSSRQYNLRGRKEQSTQAQNVTVNSAKGIGQTVSNRFAAYPPESLTNLSSSSRIPRDNSAQGQHGVSPTNLTAQESLYHSTPAKSHSAPMGAPLQAQNVVVPTPFSTQDSAATYVANDLGTLLSRQSVPPATPSITDQTASSSRDPIPSTTANWFKGTWEDRNYRMVSSYKVKMPLSFRQHSVRTTKETLPKNTTVGIEGKGNQFGLQLKPSFLAVYDGEWMRNDKWIAYRTKNFKMEINGEYRDLLGCREFAEALSDETQLAELGIDENGIFALLVTFEGKTEIRVRMTENSPVALRVLRPVGKRYEEILSSVPGKLVSYPVTRNDVVIMGQLGEMELLNNLEVKGAPEFFYYQLSKDHFWTVSILSGQQATPADEAIETNISPPATAHIDSSSGAQTIATEHSTDPVDSRIAQHLQLSLQDNQHIYPAEGAIPTHTVPPSSQANANNSLLRHTQRSRNLGILLPQEAVSNRSVINQQPLAPDLSASEQAIPSTGTDWFGGPVVLLSNLVRKKVKKWPFSFKRQFILAPSYISFDEVNRGNVGITGRSDRFSFMVRPALIIFTEGQQKSPLMTKVKSYNKKLVTALRQSEVGTKSAFGIGGNGLFLILENGPQTRLHVRAIGQLPVALKVMRRNENKWEAVLASEPGKAGYCDIMGNEVVIIGESDEISTERNLPIESPDLWSELGTMTESPFRFLISAQLVDSTIPPKGLSIIDGCHVSPTMTTDQVPQTDSIQVE